MRADARSPVLETDPMLFPCGMSRSGTTLLATVFDSHSDVSLGYELIPPPLPSPEVLNAALDEALHHTHGEFARCGAFLKQDGRRAIGDFMLRCHRAALDQYDVRRVLAEIADDGVEAIESADERLATAWRLARAKKRKQGTRVFGFKLSIPSVANAHRLFPNGRFVYILRDPRDVVASHFTRNFGRSVAEICRAWNNYLEKFDQFHARHPDVSMVIHYEQLVSEPTSCIAKMFEMLPVTIEDSVFRFYESDATVHRGVHPNADNLKKDFFTTSVERWRTDLEPAVVTEIESLCSTQMRTHAYL